ncbi:hypothetical protein V5F77_19025 [Xanthobacter sp. DSM 24535]|uniref:hypothetical protein n=1 Tax=Roseixanthobacter psychrophilus TaxID=3119917 RepID=UPI00372AB2D1
MKTLTQALCAAVFAAGLSAPAFANCPPEAANDVVTTDSTVTVSAPIPSKRT